MYSVNLSMFSLLLWFVQSAFMANPPFYMYPAKAGLYCCIWSHGIRSFSVMPSAPTSLHRGSMVGLQSLFSIRVMVARDTPDSSDNWRTDNPRARRFWFKLIRMVSPGYSLLQIATNYSVATLLRSRRLKRLIFTCLILPPKVSHVWVILPKCGNLYSCTITSFLFVQHAQNFMTPGK